MERWTSITLHVIVTESSPYQDIKASARLYGDCSGPYVCRLDKARRSAAVLGTKEMFVKGGAHLCTKYRIGNGRVDVAAGEAGESCTVLSFRALDVSVLQIDQLATVSSSEGVGL